MENLLFETPSFKISATMKNEFTITNIAEQNLKVLAGLITTCIPGQKLLCWDSISTFNENDLSGKDMFTKRLKVIKFMGMVMVARSEERRVGKECRSRWGP